MPVKIKSTSGSVTLDAQNVSGDQTLTVPSQSGATLQTTADTITSSRLSGALPALDGSSLTGVGVDGIVSSANATAITIDSAENVSVGGTPASLYSGYSSLQIGGNATIFGQTAAGGSQNMWLSQNSRAGTDGSEKAITTGMSSQVLMANGEVVLKVAPSATADANVSWTTALTVKNDGRGLSQFTAKAWVNFNGTGTLSVRDSHGVSSVSDLGGTGQYQVNFSNNMANTNYSAVTGGIKGSYGAGNRINDMTTSKFAIDNWSTSGYLDATIVTAIVFGD
ncbi:MAG: hypothetical protein KAG66_08480 [Methylococcales bacterium]|nr:hypothetical protein [Methylococcales bacterium]